MFLWFISVSVYMSLPYLLQYRNPINVPPVQACIYFSLLLDLVSKPGINYRKLGHKKKKKKDKE